MRIVITALIYLAAVGLVLSSSIHLFWLLGLFGLAIPRDTAETAVHTLFIGVFIVSVPAIIISRYFTGLPKSPDSSEPVLRECPPWMGGMGCGLAAYVALLFGIMVIRSIMWPDDMSRLLRLLLGSAFCMAFYFGVLQQLYSALVIRKSACAERSNGGNE
jgi:hypothetical protein